MRKITYFFSLLSPFTYLAGDRLEQVAARHGALVEYRPFDIMAVFAEMGTPTVPNRHPSRQAYRLQDLERLSERYGLPLNLKPRHWPTDAAPASAAVIAVADAGGPAGALARSFLSRVWRREEDIAEPAVIAAALEEVGLDASGLDDARAGAVERYAANTRAAVESGVFGAPFYVLEGQAFWGADRLGDLDWYMGRR